MTHFNWDTMERKKGGMVRFFSEMIAFRKGHPLLGQKEFLNDQACR
jgi:pullulanase/glycogen debranching enzyme